MAEPLVRSDQVTFTFDELMTEDAYDEPLTAGGVRCHGGYIDGEYVSPRGAVRRRAIRNWRGRLAEAGQPLVVVPATRTLSAWTSLSILISGVPKNALGFCLRTTTSPARGAMSATISFPLSQESDMSSVERLFLACHLPKATVLFLSS